MKNRNIILLCIVFVVLLTLSLYVYSKWGDKKQFSASGNQQELVFVSQEECERETKVKCLPQMCDIDCPLDFKKGWKAISSSHDISSWKTYRNEEYGFEFKYPGDWVLIVDERTWGIGLGFESSNYNDEWVGEDVGYSKILSGSRMGVMYQLNPDVKTLKDLREFYALGGHQSYKNEKLSSLGNEDALVYDVMVTSDNSDAAFSKLVTTIHNGSWVSFYFRSSTNSSENFDKILSTLKFTK